MAVVPNFPRIAPDSTLDRPESAEPGRPVPIARPAGSVSLSVDGLVGCLAVTLPDPEVVPDA